MLSLEDLTSVFNLIEYVLLSFYTVLGRAERKLVR